MVQNLLHPESSHIEPLRSFDSLPPEIVCHILCLLGPRDVVRLRLVSKLFQAIAHDLIVWRTIYARAQLPRPPGPFPCQSIRFLEKTLVRSERLAETWTTQPIQSISSTRLRLGGRPIGQPRFIRGRWLITFESFKQIVFRDVETNYTQILWEGASLMTHWDICSVTYSGQPLLYGVFREDTRKSWNAPWKLLEFQVDDESIHLSHSISVPAKNIGRSVCLISALSPFLHIEGQGLVFDTRSRIFYEFPIFSFETDEIKIDPSAAVHIQVLLTNTHIVVVSRRLRELDDPPSSVVVTIVQVFSLPVDRPRSGIGILRLSYEAISPYDLTNLALVRNSFIDPTTGSTNLRLLQLRPERDRLCFSCVDLTLPKSISNRVLPVSIDTYEIFTVDGGVYHPTLSSWGYSIGSSDDGHARGLCMIHAEDSAESLKPPWVTKFTVDATGDKCVADVGAPSVPRWMDVGDHLSRLSMLSFDGVIGGSCFLERGRNGSHEFVDAVVSVIK